MAKTHFIEFNTMLRCLIVMSVVSGFCYCGEDESDEDPAWIRDITTAGYKQFRYPGSGKSKPNHKDTPTEIDLYLNTVMITSIEPRTMDFTVHLNLVIKWSDDRLVVPNFLNSENKRRYEYDIPREIASKLWRPRITFRNCKGCNRILTDHNTQPYKIQPYYKRIMISASFTFPFHCDIDLSDYPFDKQHCSIIIAKEGHKRTHVPFAPTTLIRIPFVKDIRTPPHFSLLNIVASNRTNSSKSSYECVEYVFTLHRIRTNHVMMTFIPSMLIVVLSWISFWLDPAVAAPRVALGLTSILTLATQFNYAQRDLPPVATIKALDIWMFTCIFMVFVSLIVFALSNHSSRRNKIAHKQLDVRNFSELPKNPQLQQNQPGTKLAKKAECETNWSVDSFARVAFPAVFIIFNIVYWAYYASK